MSENDQKIAADLRVNFIEVINKICAKEADSKITLCDGTQQTGVLAAVDGNFEQFGFKNFSTPLGTFDSALVRFSDISAIEIPKSKFK